MPSTINLYRVIMQQVKLVHSSIFAYAAKLFTSGSLHTGHFYQKNLSIVSWVYFLLILATGNFA